MSDPADSGYECCGKPMLAIVFTLDGKPDTQAHACPKCGIWRDRWPRADPRRAQVAAEMPRIIELLLKETSHAN